MSEHLCREVNCGGSIDRRAVMKTALGAAALFAMGAGGGLNGVVYAASLSKIQRDAMTPEQVLVEMAKGNERFRNGKPMQHDYLAQKRSSAEGQYPSAVVLSCIDSRAPAEIVMDAGIGETFNSRVAGNVVNDDLLGSMEFACAVAGAKVVLVMGHTACGAIKGAIDHVELGNLTGLLARIRPAIAQTRYEGERSSKNAEFVDAVARSNVLHTIDQIRKRSDVLAKLEKEGRIKIAGAMYHLSGGRLEFL
ncbi:carbonic anhydrase [Chromobacterium haemolyticum]|uniref:Carbonic anhydrase n=1 Tax=Chromobacterium fluminis TaxID=3044269 RepID=A0ABX0L814_9NEIS|nr:carbonic anhydrase family protein [Chromobacterium haemolyticum]NHR07855.1 carbonic anhydrase [Chromobacterium haemolyticum]